MATQPSMRFEVKRGGAHPRFDRQVSIKFGAAPQATPDGAQDGDGIEPRKQFTCACSIAFFVVALFATLNFTAFVLMLNAPAGVETRIYSVNRTDIPGGGLRQLGWNIGTYYGPAICDAQEMCAHQIEAHVEIGILSIKGEVISRPGGKKHHVGEGLIKWADICDDLEKINGAPLQICGKKKQLMYFILAGGAMLCGFAALIAWTSVFCQLLVWIKLGALLSGISGVCAAISTGLWPGMIGEVLKSGSNECTAAMHLGIYAALSGDRYYNGNYTLEKVWKASAAQGDSIDVYEYDPRCNNGLVFYFGVVVAVLSLCQVCCFMGGNSPGGHDPDDDDDDEDGSKPPPNPVAVQMTPQYDAGYTGQGGYSAPTDTRAQMI